MLGEALILTILTVIAILSGGFLLHSFVRLVDRYPWIIWVSLGVLGFLGILVAWVRYLEAI